MTWRDITAALFFAAAGIVWAWLGRVPLAGTPFAVAAAAVSCSSLVCFVWTLCQVSEQPHREFPAGPARWFPGLNRLRRRLSLAEWATLAAMGFVLAALCLPATQSVPRRRPAKTTALAQLVD